ncbi:MAG: hypothetical protein HY294_09025 [Candidatus Rokubacteria bacterium]|nr:hypothetical protein [Candidatus Rokubacteria bacterium]MBI3826127.1 hypothetical protein [Candidatus Rokubacteria bacterium]
MPLHGWLGLGVILGAEAALLSGVRWVGFWLTPIVWTGYVLFADALVFRLIGRSYLTTDRAEGLGVALCSIGAWWLFEWYNAPRFWRGGDDLLGLWWHYWGLEPNLLLRRVGYDWSFATIFPALFLTAAALRASVLARVRVRPWTPPPALLDASIAAGALAVVLPLIVVASWTVVLVWTGWALLLEPLNYRAGRESWLRDLGEGDASRLASLLASGLVCGLLWEFWNYWALTKWTYTVPFLPDVKLFEMPVLGYAGFLPFALECRAMWVWVLGVLYFRPLPGNSHEEVTR